MKCGFVTIIGRPNVGKSTLLNQILGQKIVITTDKAQTTRKRIKGIYTDERGQIIFVDTPGIHRPLNKLGEYLLDEAKVAVPDADLILLLVDASEPAGKGDKWIAENLLKDSNANIILIMNKIDRVKNAQKLEENLMSYKLLFQKNIQILRVSAKTGKNKNDLITNIFRALPKGEKLYPDDIVTEENMRSVAEEIVREKILLHTQDEIPHSVAIRVAKYEEKEDIDRIYADIYCETKSQKIILIGKNGVMLKTIGTEARKELEEITDKKVYLELTVKVEKDWRKNDRLLKEFGYTQED